VERRGQVREMPAPRRDERCYAPYFRPLILLFPLVPLCLSSRSTHGPARKRTIPRTQPTRSSSSIGQASERRPTGPHHRSLPASHTVQPRSELSAVELIAT